MKKTYRKIKELLNIIKEKYPNSYDIIKYEFNNHGYDRADESNDFYACLKIRKHISDYLLINYYFHHPTNMCQSGWVCDVRIVLQ